MNFQKHSIKRTTNKEISKMAESYSSTVSRHEIGNLRIIQNYNVISKHKYQSDSCKDSGTRGYS